MVYFMQEEDLIHGFRLINVNDGLLRIEKVTSRAPPGKKKNII